MIFDKKPVGNKPIINQIVISNEVTINLSQGIFSIKTNEKNLDYCLKQIERMADKYSNKINFEPGRDVT